MTLEYPKIIYAMSLDRCISVSDILREEGALTEFMLHLSAGFETVSVEF
jgi:hypothetical protein